jgi:hypothetical protein
MRYARQRYGQAQKLGLVEGNLPGDPMAWWRQFSQDPRAWDMGQQLRAQQASQAAMGLLGGQQQNQNSPLASAVGNLVSGGNPQDQMRQDLIAQMMHLQQATPRSPLEGMAEQYKQIAGKMVGARPNPILKNLFGRSDRVKGPMKRIEAVDSASQRARQLAQIMSKRLRGS